MSTVLTEYLKELFRLWMEKGEEEATWEKLREALTNCYQKKLAASTEGKTGPGQYYKINIHASYHV